MGVPTDPVIDLLVARAKLIRRREERLTKHLIDLRCRGLTPTDVDLLLEELANQACEDRAFLSELIRAVQKQRAPRPWWRLW